MRRAVRARDESGISLVEVMVSLVLFAVVVATVDASVTVVQSHQVQVSDRTQALDYLQNAQQAITEDLHAATSNGWTSPTLPTSTSPISQTSLAFSAQLGGGTPTISIALNTATHVLTVTCTGTGCRPTGSGTVTQTTIANVDS
jgi:type II secretory pathway pseudopilin PulG